MSVDEQHTPLNVSRQSFTEPFWPPTRLLKKALYSIHPPPPNPPSFGAFAIHNKKKGVVARLTKPTKKNKL